MPPYLYFQYFDWNGYLHQPEKYYNDSLIKQQKYSNDLSQACNKYYFF